MQSKALHIKQVRVIDPGSSYHLKQCDILLKDGKISRIAPELSAKNAHQIRHDNLHVSPGWFDLRAHFCDPGEEHKEDLFSGVRAAARGGFTGVALAPHTNPVVDSKSAIEYLTKPWDDIPIALYPMAAISKGLNGTELSEMYDLYEAGAAGFSQGNKPLSHTNVLKLAMQYSREFAPPLHLLAFNEHLLKGGQMHEGAQSALLGLRGIPALTEQVALPELLHLAQYAETTIHLCGISSREGLNMLGRPEYQNCYTADVNLANLLFNDQNLQEYNSNYKVYPPLREKADQEALWEALQNGQIQAIASQHEPQAIENKRCEYEVAGWGMATLEIFFGALRSAGKNRLSLEKMIELISINPRKILNLKPARIAENEEIDLTLFDPDLNWEFNANEAESKAANYPYASQKFTGKALGTIQGERALLSSYLQ